MNSKSDGPTISETLRISRFFRAPKIESRHLVLSPQQHVERYRQTCRLPQARNHQTRLIRTWYRPIIEELIIERKRIGITQSDIERMIDCAPSLIAKYEAGLKLPSLYNLLLWCEALGMELQPQKVDL